MNEKLMIYLDHAATSWPKPPEVTDALVAFLSQPSANAGRGGHRPSVRSTRLMFETRQALARLLGVPQANDLVFTRGTTEGINLVLKGFLKQGDRVVVSPMEHNAVMRPLRRLENERGVRIDTLPADEWGRLDMEGVAAKIAEEETALAVVTHAANVNGIVQDLTALRSALGQTPLLVDAAQTAGVLPIHIREQGIDFLACSAHKGLLGPTGVGVCYISPRHDVQPLCEGGTGSLSESPNHPTHRPDRYEAGTQNLHGIAGLQGAMAALETHGLTGDHKREMATMLIDGLSQIDRVRLYSPADGTALLATFTIEGLAPEEIAERLEEEHNILTRPGLHCAPKAHIHLGTFPEGAVRLSPGWGTSQQNIETAINAVREIAASL